MNKQDPDISPDCTADDEIDLVDLFLIIWKRKWMIVKWLAITIQPHRHTGLRHMLFGFTN